MVNAGSNTVSIFRIRENLRLRLTYMQYVVGVGPNSITYRDGLVCVLSIDADGIFNLERAVGRGGMCGCGGAGQGATTPNSQSIQG